jgi:hypothetical protein
VFKEAINGIGRFALKKVKSLAYEEFLKKRGKNLGVQYLHAHCGTSNIRLCGLLLKVHSQSYPQLLWITAA